MQSGATALSSSLAAAGNAAAVACGANPATSGNPIGLGGLFDIGRALTATLFVGIGEPEHRGKGNGLEAARLICEYGSFFRSLRSIKVEVNGYNRGAIKLYEKLGFQRVGRVRGVIMRNGYRYDQVSIDLAARRAA